MIITTAMALVMLITFTALAIDIGLGASRTRDLHQVADLIAVDVARILDGSNPPPTIDAQVAASSARNGFPVSGTFPIYTGGDRRVELTLGCWVDPDPNNANDLLRFETCTAPDAVRVRAFDTVDYLFADVIGLRESRFDRTGTAARRPTLGVEIGSVAAGLRTGLDGTNTSAQIDAYVDALNGRLRAAFGTSATFITPPGDLGLDAVSYRGLANSDISWGDLASNAGFGSPSELSNATLTHAELFEATARSLEGEGNTVAAAQVRSFAGLTGFDSTGTTTLGSGPLQFEQGTGTAADPGAARARVNVLDLLIGAASVADGRNFFSYEITPQIPGVASVRVETRVVEPMQRRFGPVGTTVNTAQIRQQLTINLDGAQFGITDLAGAGLPLTIPIVIEGATGDATLQRIECLDPRPLSEADVFVVTTLARATVGVAQNLQAIGNPALNITSAVVLEAGPLSVSSTLNLGLSVLAGLTGDITATGTASLGGGTSSHLFHPDATPNPLQRSPGGVATSFGTSLQSAMTLSGIPVLGQTFLRTSMDTLFSELGAGIIDPVLHAAGITLGGADVGAIGPTNCDEPQLVE